MRLRIGNKQFRNFEAPPLETTPAIVQPAPLEESRIKLLLLKALRELHIRNTKEIETLRYQTFLTETTSIVAVICIVISIVIAIKFYKRRIEVRLIQSEAEQQSQPKSFSVPSLHNIPYF